MVHPAIGQQSLPTGIQPAAEPEHRPVATPLSPSGEQGPVAPLRGLCVLLAENGLVAVKAFITAASSDASFCLVLMDMQMPEVDGYEATAQPRKARVEQTVIAMAIPRTGVFLLPIEQCPTPPFVRCNHVA